MAGASYVLVLHTGTAIFCCAQVCNNSSLTKKMPFLFDFSSMYVYGVQTQWSKVES